MSTSVADRNAIVKGWTSENLAENLLKVVPDLLPRLVGNSPSPDFGGGGALYLSLSPHPPLFTNRYVRHRDVHLDDGKSPAQEKRRITVLYYLNGGMQ